MERQKATSSRGWRKIGWLGCLGLALLLVIGAWREGSESVKQAFGVRRLMQSGVGIAEEELKNPFVCMREGVYSTRDEASLLNISDEYLRGVGLCLINEREAGMIVLKEVKGNENAEVQYAAGLSANEPQAGVEVLAGLDLVKDKFIDVLQRLSDLPSIEPYPALRQLAQQAKDQPETWRLWLQASFRLEEVNEWQAALGWLEEGLAIAPAEVRGSLTMREGRIWQTKAEPRDNQAALSFYNLALERGGWITASDIANAHLYRGEVYRNLKEEYSPEQALAEFQRTLELAPGKYSALLNIGHVYLYDLKELEQAESYYKQALSANEEAPNAYLHLGDVFRARGDKISAAEWYRQALERQPNWQLALDRLKELEGK